VTSSVDILDLYNQVLLSKGNISKCATSTSLLMKFEYLIWTSETCQRLSAVICRIRTAFIPIWQNVFVTNLSQCLAKVKIKLSLCLTKYHAMKMYRISK
jgi:hypothetical protein